MIKSLAGVEYEAIRGITAWYRLTRDHRGSSTQRILGLVGRVFQPPRCQKMAEAPGSLELWESRIREYERLVLQVEKLETRVPDSCKVFIVRNLVPKELEKDLLRIHPTASYKTTKMYVLEQANLKKHAHFEERQSDKPVPMEVDVLLAKIAEMKGGMEDGDQGGDAGDGGGEAQGEDAQGGRTLEDIEKDLLALKGIGKGGKDRGGKRRNRAKRRRNPRIL